MKSGKTEKAKFILPWVVVLLALIFPLFLYANNLGEVTLESLWRPVLFSLLLGISIFGVVYLLIHDSQKAGLITGILELFIFSYGHIYNLLKSIEIFNEPIGRHRYLFPVLLLMVVFLIWRLFKHSDDNENLIKIANILTLVLFLIQTISIVVFEAKSLIAGSQSSDKISMSETVDANLEQRDIYLIVLDAYSRSDWLKEWSAVDNTDFLNTLGDLGFYIAPCSRSNYSYTIQAMTSELNMDYLQNLNVPYTNTEMSVKLKNSEVRQRLSEEGYEFIFFETGYPWIEMEDADRFIEAEEQSSSLDDFEFLYFKTTALLFPYDTYQKMTDDKDIDLSVKRYAARVNSALNHLKKPLKESEPLFVYAHIVSPHSPRVFNANGSINHQWEQNPESATHATYSYINDQVLEIVSTILENSNPEPIIIIQADHGDGEYGYRNLILNAYYFPDGGASNLYPTITPVNTFRLIFDYYFQTDFGLLDDRSYYSPEKSRFEFEVVKDPYNYCQELNED